MTKLNRRQLRKIIQESISLILTEGEEEKLAKLSLKKDRSSIHDIIDGGQEVVSKSKPKLDLTLPDGNYGTISIFDPERNIFKIDIKPSDREGQPRSVGQAYSEYEDLKNKLLSKGKGMHKYESSYFAQITNPGTSKKKIKIVPTWYKGKPGIKIKGGF